MPTTNKESNITTIPVDYIIYIFLIICLQLTEVKIYSLKVSEIIILVLGFFLKKKAFKYEKKLIYIYVFFLFKTLFFNFFETFYVPSDIKSFLKLPYVISLSRFIELLVCYVLLNLSFDFFYSRRKLANLHLSNIIKIQVWIAAIFTIVYVMYILGILHLKGDDYESFIVYNTNRGYDVEYRINGFYVEGGPIGLFYACMFVIFTIIEKKSFFLKIFILLFLIFGTQSKAGISLIVLYFIIDYFYISNKRRNWLVIIFAIFLFLISFSIIIYVSYLESLNNIELIAQSHTVSGAEDIDRNHFMGRVAATVIVPNMLYYNFFSGIGLGNYALVRNNPLYRSFIPEVPYWDLHGFGGGFDILVEGGCIIFLLFIIYLRTLWKKCYTINQKKVFIVFILSFIFGVQLYFLYPWFILSYLLFLQKTETKELQKRTQT